RLGTIFLSVLQSEGLAARAAKVGSTWRAHLQSRLAEIDQRFTVRGEGLMIGIDLCKPLAGVKTSDELRKMGVIALPSSSTGQVLSLTPPLVIEPAQVSGATEAIMAACAK